MLKKIKKLNKNEDNCLKEVEYSWDLPEVLWFIVCDVFCLSYYIFSDHMANIIYMTKFFYDR